jgi:hypothetical protein
MKIVRGKAGRGEKNGWLTKQGDENTRPKKY